MKEERRKELEELFSNGKWTEFLNGLPSNYGGIFQFKTAGQIMTLRVIASQQTQKGARKYSIKGIDYEKMTAYIEVSPKNGNA